MAVNKDRNNLSTNKQVTVRNGAPGDGKTRLTVYEVVFLASVMWLRLRYLYWRDKSKVEKWRRTGNTEALKDFKEIEDSYLYYTTPQIVNGKEVLPLPCLFSNIGIVNEDGLYSSKLTFEHLSQKSRPPSYTIEFIDEWGTAFDLEMSNDKPLEISDRARFIRQWYENLMFGTEQDAKNTFIDMRRVVARNDFMQGCKDYLKPLPLVLLFKFLQRYFARSQKLSKTFSPFMCVLEKLIKSTGFVRFRYRPEGNTEHKQTLEGLVNFTIPAYSNSRYDSRAFRRLNACAALPISGEVHTELSVEETAQNCLDWLRAEMTTAETEAKEIQREAAFWDTEALKDENAKYRAKYPAKYSDYLSRK